MRKFSLFFVIVFFAFIAAATVTQLVFNSPADNFITGDNFQLLNITVENNDTSESMEVSIYGSNDSIVSNKSLIYRRSNVTNGTEIVFNWTSPKLITDKDTVLLMYFDNQSEEGNLSELDVNSDMVFLYHLNNDSSFSENDVNVYDFTDNGNNGTAVGTTANASGKIRGAFEFDGVNDFIDVPSSDLITLNEGTISMWVKSTDDSYNSVFSVGDASLSDYFELSIGNGATSSLTNELITISTNIFIFTSNRIGYTTTNRDELFDGEWHHIALTSSGSSYILYLDGNSLPLTVGSGSNNGEFFSDVFGADNARLGSTNISGSGNIRFFNGTMDDVSVYNRALDGHEIREVISLRLLDETGINNGTRFKYDEVQFNNSGKLGPALGFDGVDDYAVIPDSNSLDLTDDFSISFWAYPRNLNKNQTFLAKGASTTVNYFVDYKATSEIEFGFYNGAFRSIRVDASGFSADEWNLITATWNESSNISRVYINGVDKGSLQIDQDISANTEDLSIGYFSGYNQNFSGMIDELVIYNKTLIDDEVEDIYRLKEGIWYWRFSAKDSGGLNASATRSFEVGSTWTVTPTDLGSIGSALNTNVSVGTITINNTDSIRNITVNITSDYDNGFFFNETLPLNLTNTNGEVNNTRNNTVKIQINVTSPLTEGIETIRFNVSATDRESGEASVPASREVSVTLVSTSSQPFLISRYETVPSVVSQNNTGINLEASVTNLGQGNAQSVSLTFELPDGWTNSSKALTQSLGILLVNEQKNVSLTADIGSDASSGIVTLYANVSGQNDTGDDLNLTYLNIGSANVTVNQISIGAGPSAAPTSAATGGGGGGGGGGISIGGLETSAVYEIIRGKDERFFLPIENKFLWKMQNIDVQVSGFLSQYIEIEEVPLEIAPNSSANVTIHIIAPSYFTEGEWPLDFRITAVLQRITAANTTQPIPYSERRSVILAIHELSGKEAAELIDLSFKEIEKIEKLNLTAKKLRRLLEGIEKKLEARDYEGIKAIYEQIKSTVERALEAYDKINELNAKIEEARENGIDTPDTQRLVELALVALNREDYFTAFERLRDAEFTFNLETKGEFSVVYFIRNNPIQVFFMILASSVFLIFSMRVYRLGRINYGLKHLTKEQGILRGLIKTAQREAFEQKTISMGEYNTVLRQYEKRLNEAIKKEIEFLSTKAVLLNPLVNQYELEKKRLLNLIKQTQDEYVIQGKQETRSYRTKLDSYYTRLSEVEGKAVLKEVKLAINKEKMDKLLSRFRKFFNIKKKVKEGAGIEKRGIITRIKERIRFLIFRLFKRKKDIVMIDSKVIDKIKEKVKGKDVKGKWINVNLRRKKE